MKILLATDGSSCSEMAAKTLVALGPPADTEIFTIHVKEPPHYVATPAQPQSSVSQYYQVQHQPNAEAEESATRAIDQAAHALAVLNLPLRPMMAEGDPAEQIIAAADQIGADLTVVGSTGQTEGSLFALGSVSQKVKRYSRNSVLLANAPPGSESVAIRRVLLATDGSENASEAALFLSGFQLPVDAEVTLLNVVQYPSGISPFSTTPSIVEQVRQARLSDARRLLEESKRQINTGGAVNTLVAEGDPSEQILRAAADMNADLIVVGSKGLGGIKLFLLGSVSQRVCRYADRSVLLVKMRHVPDSDSEGRSV